MHGIWGCDLGSAHCCLGTFCPCFLLARLRMTQRLHAMWPRNADFHFALTFYSLIYIIAYASGLTEILGSLLVAVMPQNNFKRPGAFRALEMGGLVCDLAVLFLLTQLRGLYRMRNNIEVEDANRCVKNDCVCACLCGCCVLIQIADDADPSRPSCCSHLTCTPPTDAR